MINTKGTISLLVGQCGIQVGDAIFDELASSYMLQNNGKNVTYNNFNDQHDVNNNVDAFFDEKYHARAILVDTEAKVVANTIAKSKHRKWKYSNNNKKDIDSISVVRQGGAANNWAYGYMDQSNIEVATQTIEKVRKQIEKLDYLYGFNIISSAAGGTGSGVGTRLNEELGDIYKTIPLVHIVILPFEAGEVAVQSLNSILSLSHIIKNNYGGTIIARNDLAFMTCKRNGISSPGLNDLNNVIARNVSSIFAAAGSSFYADCIPHLWSQNNLYPFVELKSVPQTSEDAIEFNNDSWEALGKELSREFLDKDHNKKMYSSFLFLHGPDSNHFKSDDYDNNNNHYSILMPNDKVKATWEMLPIWRNATSWKSIANPKPWRGYMRSCTLAMNSKNIIEPLTRMISKASDMIRTDAYLHQYSKHGIDKIEFCNSALRLERIVSCYSEL